MCIPVKIITTCLIVIFLPGCNYFSFSPRSKQNIRQEQPSLQLLDKIVYFRIEQFGWASSKADFISKGEQYHKAFQDFPYIDTNFKIKDSGSMEFYFSDHIKDIDHYKQTGQTEINSYGGVVDFYKYKDKFVWKIKMNKIL